MKVRFYLNASGRSPVEEFLSEMELEIRKNFQEAQELLEHNLPIGMPLSRNLSSVYNGLHELRFKDRYGIYRFFYYIKKNDAIYFIHALKKKTQKIPYMDIELIINRIRRI